MKVIFLDIDGVLNCDHTTNPRKFPYVVDKKLLARFKKLLSRTGAKVVLSSSWRLDPVGSWQPSIGASRSSTWRPICQRKLGETKFLRGSSKHPNVIRYTIIDDEDDELDALPLFQPSCKTGITAEIVKGVEKYLSGKTDDNARQSPRSSGPKHPLSV
jgi:hypothetical protein